MKVKSFDLKKDIYYQKQYVSLYLNPGEELFEFSRLSDRGLFYELAIKRPIQDAEFQEFYDLETVYGYGGMIYEGEPSFCGEVLAEYEAFCKQEKIVAQFVRFHPFNKLFQAQRDFFNFFSLDRQVVVVDLSQSKADRFAHYGQSTRNIIKRAQESLVVSFSYDVDKFKELYDSTMLRNGATDFYFFSKEYFLALLQTGAFLIEVKQEEEVVCMGFFLIGEELAHYHLSASSEKGLKLNANYLLLEQGFSLAKEKGCSQMLLGGGRTNQADDGLLRFKQKFSSLTADFYLGGRIYDMDKYQALNAKWLASHPGKVKTKFLQYRFV